MMIRQSFIFLERISHATEVSLWDQGILSWKDFIAAGSIRGLSSMRKLRYQRELIRAEERLRSSDLRFFAGRFPPSERFRFYKEFRDMCLFLDIETGIAYDDITVIGLSDGDSTHHLIKGFNLDKGSLERYLHMFPIVITFNGSSFDIPVIQRKFGNVFKDSLHIDLRHVCDSLGFSGGLKKIEADLRLQRDYSVPCTHIDPSSLWYEWEATRSEDVLELLLEYNSYDVKNMRHIADMMFSLKEDIVNNQKARSACSL